MGATTFYLLERSGRLEKRQPGKDLKRKKQKKQI